MKNMILMHNCKLWPHFGTHKSRTKNNFPEPQAFFFLIVVLVQRLQNNEMNQRDGCLRGILKGSHEMTDESIASLIR